MDAFTAAGAYINPHDSAVNQYIQSRQAEFHQFVGQSVMDIVSTQHDVLQLQAPSMTLEQIERVQVGQRNVINPYAIERMESAYHLQTATAHNQQLVMAHPTLNKLHRLGQLEGYGLDQDDTLAHLLQNRITSGMVVNENGKGVHREHSDDCVDLNMYNTLTALQRRVVQDNQRSAIACMLDDIDFSSIFNGGF